MNTTTLRSGLVLSLLGGAALVASLPASAQTYNSPSNTPAANTPPASTPPASAPSSAPSMNAPSNTSSTTAAKTTDDDAAEFARLDKNKDGFIDKSEAILEPRLLTNFEAADTNKDGKIDMNEWKAFQKNKDLVKKQ